MTLSKEDWMNRKWRPAMAWVYMVINIFDFIVGPVVFNFFQYHAGDQAITSYQAITLQGGGLVHVAFGAILGISAYTRGREKLASIQKVEEE
jgi:Na+/melibiose symporter-like transporter